MGDRFAEMQDALRKAEELLEIARSLGWPLCDHIKRINRLQAELSNNMVKKDVERVVMSHIARVLAENPSD